MGDTSNNYEKLRIILLQLAEELVSMISSEWIGDWSNNPPKAGWHFTYLDIKTLPSFSTAKEELVEILPLKNKYSNHGLETFLFEILELIIGIYQIHHSLIKQLHSGGIRLLDF